MSLYFSVCFQCLTNSWVETDWKMDSGVTVITNPTVNVRLTSTISSFEAQRRFNRGASIAELKVRHHTQYRRPFIKSIRVGFSPSLFWNFSPFVWHVHFEMFYSGKVGDDCGCTCLLHGLGVIQCLWQVPAENGWQWSSTWLLSRGRWLQNTRMSLPRSLVLQTALRHPEPSV